VDRCDAGRVIKALAVGAVVLMVSLGIIYLTFMVAILALILGRND
jgi:hypothetical protein